MGSGPSTQHPPGLGPAVHPDDAMAASLQEAAAEDVTSAPLNGERERCAVNPPAARSSADGQKKLWRLTWAGC